MDSYNEKGREWKCQGYKFQNFRRTCKGRKSNGLELMMDNQKKAVSTQYLELQGVEKKHFLWSYL